jgi:D-alanyl-D-alanine carboxypeptidase/poly-gamma-glutamate capsule biosynthesis protein CapA/YwtB (metallophosphatase superfamily)
MHSLKKRLTRIVLILGAISIGIIVAAALFSGSQRVLSYFKKSAPLPIALTDPKDLVKTETIAAGPSYLIKKDTPLPKVSADAYLIGDLDSGSIILEKNPDTPYPIASVSKLMTALVSLTDYDQTGTVTATRQALATYGTNGGFYAGEKLPLSQLIYPLLMESSNDAATIISNYQSSHDFVAKMNQMAAKLGLANTGYVEPTGLSPENHSTVTDLFKLTSYIAANDPLIFHITTLPNYSYKNHTWYGISQFLHVPGFAGSKPGFIDEAKETNIGLFTLPLANKENKNLAIILLHSDDRYADTQKLLAYIKKNVYYGDKDAYPFATPANGQITAPDDISDLVFVGDIMLDRGIKQNVETYFGGDYGRLFENVPQIKDADIAFANLEGPASDIGTDQGTIYSFRMDPKSLTAVRDAGFDVLSNANNHVGDWGRDAYADTLGNVAIAGMSSIGGGKTHDEAATPKIIISHGIKIGFLGFTDVGPNWLAATATDPGVLLASDPNFDQIVQDAAAKCDVLVTSFHFGVEYSIEHSERQQELAHRAIDDGAKLVIGTHPHVIEDTETYKGGYIAYSLGNFIFDQNMSKDTAHGLMLEV